MSLFPLLLLVVVVAGSALVMWYMLSGRMRDDAAPLRARLWLKIWQWKQRRERRRHET